MDNFYNLDFCQGLWGGGGHLISNAVVIVPFNYDEQNDYLKILSNDLGKKEKRFVGGGLVALRFFWSLTKEQ